MDFFKVYVATTCCNQLSLPKSFGDMFAETIPVECTLADGQGIRWRVQLSRTDEDLIIEHGWSKFASHYDLSDGDFLIFIYDGRDFFNVKIFGRNGLKKVTVRESAKDGNDVASETDEVIPGLPRNLYRDPMPQGSDKAVHTYPMRPNFGEMQRRGKKRRISSRHKSFVSTGWTLKLSKERMYSARLPQIWVCANRIMLRSKATLISDEGKMYSVVVKHATGRVDLSSGWHQFLIANKAKIGDQCVFESSNSTVGGSTLLRVQVVRRK